MLDELLNIQPYKIDPSLAGKKFTFYGGPGTRKTTVSCKFPDNLLLATERGYLFIDGVKKKDLTSWGEFIQTANALTQNDELKDAYRTITLDRADTLYKLCRDSTCAALGIKDPSDLGFGKGWSAVRRAFENAIGRLERAGYGINFIIHDKDLYEEGTLKKIGSTTDLEKAAKITIMGLSDFVFHLRPVPVDPADPGKGRTVFAYTQAVDADSKSRARYFTPKFEFTFDNLERELALAIQKQVQIEGIETQVKGRVEVKDQPFAELQADVVDLVRKAQEKQLPNFGDIVQLIKMQLQGKKITEVPESFYEPLLVIKEYILSIL